MPQAAKRTNTRVSHQKFSAADFYRKLRQFGANPYAIWLRRMRPDGTVKHEDIGVYTETGDVPHSVYAEAERFDPGRKARRRYVRKQYRAASVLEGGPCVVQLGLPRSTPISQRIWRGASSDEVSA